MGSSVVFTPSPRERGEGELQVAQSVEALLAAAPHPNPLPSSGEREERT